MLAADWNAVVRATECVNGWLALSSVLSRTQMLRVWSPPAVLKLLRPFLSWVAPASRASDQVRGSQWPLCRVARGDPRRQAQEAAGQAGEAAPSLTWLVRRPPDGSTPPLLRGWCLWNSGGGRGGRGA